MAELIDPMDTTNLNEHESLDGLSYHAKELVGISRSLNVLFERLSAAYGRDRAETEAVMTELESELYLHLPYHLREIRDPLEVILRKLYGQDARIDLDQSPPDEVCSQAAERGMQLMLRLLDEETILIEGRGTDLESFGQLLVAQARFEGDDGFQISPSGPGAALFEPEATLGVYIHRVDDGPAVDAVSRPTDSNSSHPYTELEGTPLWRALDEAIGDLVENQDLTETTARHLIVGSLAKKVAEALGHRS